MYPIRFRSVAALALSMLLATAAHPQEVAPLVREESTIKARVGSKKDKNVEPDKPGSSDRVDPRRVMVAIVNNHGLSRADLDRRMQARTGDLTRLKDDVATEITHLASPKGKSGAGPDSPEAALEMAAEREMSIRDALRKEESDVVELWADQMMLADEARRQGLVIDDKAFRERMEQIEKEYDLNNPRVDNMLNVMGMTRDEFESHVYDALLVERLLDRFVALNTPEERLREVYDKNPAMFRTPPMYRAAHFTVVLNGKETASEMKGLKKTAEKVEARLAKGEDFEKVFEEANKIDYGFFGADTGYFSIEKAGPPPVVLVELAKMKKGDTSEVLTSYVRREDKAVPESFHVIKVLDILPETGTTYETAQPKLHEAAREGARMDVLALIRKAKTHKRIVNLRGIPPDKIPPTEERIKAQPAVALAVKKSAAKPES